MVKIGVLLPKLSNKISRGSQFSGPPCTNDNQLGKQVWLLLTSVNCILLCLLKRCSSVVELPPTAETSRTLYHSAVFCFTSVGVGRIYFRVRPFVCLSLRLFVCLFVRSITQKRMIPKCSNLVFLGNDLGISCKWYCFGLKGQRSTLGLELGLTAMQRGFELYECLL